MRISEFCMTVPEKLTISAPAIETLIVTSRLNCSSVAPSYTRKSGDLYV